MKYLKKTLAPFAPIGVAALSAFAALTLGSGLANAATVQIKFDDNIFNGSGYDAVHIKFANANNVGSSTHYVAAGRFQGTASNVQGVPKSVFYSGLNDVYMYCYDLYESINHGQTVVYTVNLNGAQARTLDFIGAVNAVMNIGNTTFNPYAWLTPVNASQGAAIQLGIWESKYESAGFDLTGGKFSAWSLDAATQGYWNSFSNAIGSSDAIDGQYVMTLTAPGAQDMIAGDPPLNVPEPGSLALMGLGLAGLVAARRRRST